MNNRGCSETKPVDKSTSEHKVHPLMKFEKIKLYAPHGNALLTFFSLKVVRVIWRKIVN